MKNLAHKISVLLPETSLYHTSLLVNCLSENKNIKIYVISNLENPEIRRSNKITNFAYYSKTNTEKEWLKNIETELSKHSIDLVVPIDVYGFLTLIKNKKKVSFSSKIGVLPNIKSFEIANNKFTLTEHLKKYNIDYPETYNYTLEGLLENSVKKYPILIKPSIDNGGGGGIVKLNNFIQLKEYLLSGELDFEFIVQKYIYGYDIDCSVICEKGKILAYTIQKGILPGDREFEPSYGVKFLYEEKLFKVVEKLMMSLNWSGVAHVDLRYDLNDKNYKVIEINPRFWVSVDASLAAGINFPYLYVLRSLELDFSPQKYKPIKYFDLSGLSKSIKKNKLFLLRLKFILTKTPIRFYVKDPIPLLLVFKYKLKSLFYNL